MPLEEKPVLERARAEISSGRLWKARDRLTGALRGDPYDQAVLELLGEVYFEMGELPAAGSSWILTERSGEDYELAMSALLERHSSDPVALLRTIPVGCDLERYPLASRERIIPLLERARERGYELHKGHLVRASAASSLPTPWGKLKLRIGCSVALLFTVGIWLVGLVVLVIWFLGALIDSGF